MQDFAKAYRLLKADEFSSVFVFRKVKTGNYFRVHYKPNQLGYARLGLVVSKKVHKRANKRNYIKRLLRELFRFNRESLLDFDIVIRVTKLFTHDDYLKIKLEFKRLFADMETKKIECDKKIANCNN